MPARITALALLLAAPAAFGASYLDELRSRARELHLDRHPQWQALLHYQPNKLLPGVTSRVDSANFFVSPDGRTDPDSELQATLASFFSAAEREGEPPQCRVKARYEWLKTLLRFDPQRLPEQTCERYEKWLAAIDPGALGVVFASSSLSSSATMFGHSLMKLDVRSRGPDQKLLANAINYAAVYDENDAGMLYAARGIAGGYVGVFSMGPYYEKVNEYARIESRDLWEYPLALDAAAVQRLVWHVWEMREVEFDYYFFDENCSYLLLALVNVARPDLRLLEDFPQPLAPHVIPLDTIRSLQRKGVLGTPAWRPALANKLRHTLAQLSPAEYEWVLDYATDEAQLDDAVVVGATPQRRAALLDAAHDYLYFQFREDIIERDLGLPRAQAALRERSRIAARSDLVELPRPPVSPDRGHGSNRVSLGARVDRHGASLLLRSRDALHDLLDPSPGYLDGGQIEFVNLGLLLNQRSIKVLDFRAVGVQSVAPWDRAFRPWSWFAGFGARRFGLDALSSRPANALGFYAEGGGGISLALGARATLFGYGELQLDANPDLRQAHSLAPGLRAGLSSRLGEGLTQLFEAQWLVPVSGDIAPGLFLRGGLQWSFAERFGLRANGAYARRAKLSALSGELLLNYYF